MNESNESLHTNAAKHRWLLLITQVPSQPAYLRVKLRRRVQRLGAVGLKGAVYALPQSPVAMENFQGLRREILADGGAATLCGAQLLDGMTDGELRRLFDQDRDIEYQAFVVACGELEARWSVAGAGARSALVAEREKFYSRLEGILGRDFFSADGREEAMQALERLAVLDILGARTSLANPAIVSPSAT